MHRGDADIFLETSYKPTRAYVTRPCIVFDAYLGGKVLIEMMGLQMASFAYQSTPMEVIDMLNDLEDVDKQLLVTEANYWVDNPYTDTGVDDSNYGYGPEKYW